MKHHAPPPRALHFLGDALGGLEREGLLRVPNDPLAPGSVSFCANDYLGLAGSPAARASAGAGGSRLVSGDHVEHRALEAGLARWLGTTSSLVFSSGYAANVGLLSSLAGPEDLIVSDALNHASLIDGARLSRARVVVVPHLDLDAIRRAVAAPRTGRAWVVTESYFSMDADAPDLAALRQICDHEAAGLIVDEAHAVGVLGPAGRGLCAEAGVVPDALVGTFGKAFGASGAFVAGCSDLRAWLWNRARSFVFSTGMAPAAAASAHAALEIIESSPSLRAATAARAQQLRSGLLALGITPLGFGHIIPWVIGDADAAVRTARALIAGGAHVQAIRPPSVPPRTARLRLTVNARHTDAEIAGLLAAIQGARSCAAP